MDAYRAIPPEVFYPREFDSPNRHLVEVTVTWNGDTLGLAHLHPGERFVLVGGPSPRPHSFVHPAITRGERALFTYTADALRVAPIDGATVEMDGENGWRVVLDGVVFTARRVKALAVNVPMKRPDARFWVTWALSVVAMLLVSATVRGHARKPSPASAEKQMRELVERIQRVTVRRESVPQPESDCGVRGGRGTRHRGEEGSAGHAHRQPRYVVGTQRGQADGTRGDARAQSARQQVEQRGIFAAVGRSPTASPFAGLFGGDSSNTRGAFYGAQVGDAFGYGGLGATGHGWGGGGTGEGTIGLGRLFTRGRGENNGTSMGQGSGSACGCADGANLSNRSTSAPSVRFGSRGFRLRVCGTEVTRPDAPPQRCGEGADGALIDPAAIRRVVVRNMGQVRRCYENSLHERPGTQGRVSVRWVIGANGDVLASSVTDDTTSIASLGECVAGAVRRWQFPVVGTVATVNYPFDFQLTD